MNSARSQIRSKPRKRSCISINERLNNSSTCDSNRDAGGSGTDVAARAGLPRRAVRPRRSEPAGGSRQLRPPAVCALRPPHRLLGPVWTAGAPSSAGLCGPVPSACAAHWAAGGCPCCCLRCRWAQEPPKSDKDTVQPQCRPPRGPGRAPDSCLPRFLRLRPGVRPQALWSAPSRVHDATCLSPAPFISGRLGVLCCCDSSKHGAVALTPRFENQRLGAGPHCVTSLTSEELSRNFLWPRRGGRTLGLGAGGYRSGLAGSRGQGGHQHSQTDPPA